MKKIRWARVIGVGLVVGAALLTSGYLLNTSEDVKEVEYTYHVVKPGETLWDIAGEVAGANKDVREVIYDIQADNDLGGKYLQIGQKLKIRKEAK